MKQKEESILRTNLEQDGIIRSTVDFLFLKLDFKFVRLLAFIYY